MIQKAKQKSALIVGAGIGGLTAAHALQQNGWHAQVFERAAAFDAIGAGIQLSPNATRVLARLGLLDQIRAQAFAPQAAVIRDGLSGKTQMYAPLKGFCERFYGAPYLHIYRPDLHAVLAQGLDISLKTAAIGYESGAVHFHRQRSGEGLNPTENQNPRPVKNQSRAKDQSQAKDQGPAKGQSPVAADFSVTADLIVAADGLRSTLQQQVNGPQPPRFTGQVAWRGLVSASSDLHNLIPKDATVWIGRGQHLVTYFLRPDLINFVAVTEQDDWREQGWNLPGPMSELQDRFQGWHPAIQTLLTACETSRRWALFDRPPLPRWVDGTVALLGDSAHPTLPFLAQGAALAIEDAWALARYAPNLTAYERTRKPRATALQTWARSNANLYHQTRQIDRLKMRLSRNLCRGPQAHALLWQIFRA